MWMIRWLLVAVLLIVLLGFSLLNLDQRVSIDLALARWDDLPLLLVLFEAFIAGMLVWFAVSFVTVARLQKELRALRRERDRLADTAGGPMEPARGVEPAGGEPEDESRDEGDYART
jgi:uncharacterized integral membrane protein